MWKHKESKWLVRGGRKVKCYLCGKKILAKGDLFLFHGDTGYYSHQSCMTESTTISGNERRRAVKKIAVGAAVVGAIAAGAGKFLDVSSQSKNSPTAQTILTSQGLIPPALTSDPANPVPGQMWYRSDAGVMAHFDGVQNRVVYSSEINDGNVHVTSKGIINGLSVLPNDGTGWFGPDTTKGATAPGQCGSPYTQTAGTQEMLTFIGNNTVSGMNFSPTPISQYNVRFIPGIYLINTTVLYPNVTTKIYGSGAVLKWNGTTSSPIMQYAQPSLYVNNNYISDLMLDPNPSSSTPASYGLYFVQTAAEANNTNIYEKLVFREGFTEYQSGLVLNGEATDQVINCYFGIGQSAGTKAGLSCDSPGSGIYIIASYFNSADGAYLNTQQNSFISSLLSTISMYSGVLQVENSYWLGAGAFPDLPCIYVPAGTLCQINIDNCDIGVGTNRPLINTGVAPVQITTLEVSNSTFSVTIASGSTSASMINIPGLTAEYIMSLKLENNVVFMPNDTDTFTGPFTLIPNPNTSFNSSGNQYLIGKAIPTLSANPPASSTVYQNTNPYDIRLKVPVTYSPTSTAAATLATGTSTSSTVTTSTKVSYPAGITTGIINTYEMVVPAGQYFELVATNATIGTVEVQAA